MSALYPLIFKETLKEKIWGGDAMGSLLGKNIAIGETIGESWEVSDHGLDSSIIANGKLAGNSLHKIFTDYKVELMGQKLAAKYADKFPLLVKFLDARENLSVQVHPNDQQAGELEVNELGKTECWYVLYAKDNATIIKGVNQDLTKEQFKQAIVDGKVMDVLDEFSVKTGDFLFLPAGTIHAICSGTVIAEIQQNSDTTYRVYDYNRKGLDGKTRELHIDKTLAVADLSKSNNRIEVPLAMPCDGAERFRLNKCDKFWVDKLSLTTPNKASVELSTDDEVQVLMIVAGEGQLRWCDNNIDLQKGMTLLIPASLNKYSLHGSLEVLLSAPV